MLYLLSAIQKAVSCEYFSANVARNDSDSLVLGDTVSVTKGIVSRIEAGPYTETLEMLQIQIDAAINGTNHNHFLSFIFF